jgi:hypothetical protein
MIARNPTKPHLASTWSDVFERGARTVAELAEAIDQRR